MDSMSRTQTSPAPLTRPDGTPIRILAVDDESSLTELLSMAMRYEGWQVSTAASGNEAVKAAREVRPDAIVLDMMLPDFDGLEVMRRVRSEDPDVPVIFLTAKDAVADRINGLTAGGDDYVTKPFSLEEVIARLRALLRRSGAATGRSESLLVVGDLTLDEDSHEVSRAGDPIQLTATEFELLRYLMRNPRRVLSKAQILDRVWNYDFGGQANVVELYISYLRKKIDANRAADDPHHARRRVRAAPGRVMSPATDTLDTSPTPAPTGRGTLARQLVLRVVGLVAVIAVLLCLFTALATRTQLTSQLDSQLMDAKSRAMRGVPGPSGSDDTPPEGIQTLGQTVGTLMLIAVDGIAAQGDRAEGRRAAHQADLDQRRDGRPARRRVRRRPGHHDRPARARAVSRRQLDRLRRHGHVRGGAAARRGRRGPGQPDRGGDRAVRPGRRRRRGDRPRRWSSAACVP